MFHSRTSNKKVNLLHERALRTIYNDQTLSFEEIIHYFNIQSLAIVMFKISNNEAPTIIDDLFTRSHRSYNLCSKSNFVVPVVRTVHNGQNSLQYYGFLIWDMTPDYIKYSENFRHIQKQNPTMEAH